MRKTKFVRSLFVILIIVGAVFAFNNPMVRYQFVTMFHLYGGNVLGVNTVRAGGITNQLQKDVNGQIDQVRKQAFNLKISDVMSFFNKTQKVAKDFKSVQNYVKDQTGNLHIGSNSATKKSH